MKKVERYLRRGSRSVAGWLEPFSARFIAELCAVQAENEISGAAAEIGVHHGRLFILMHLAGRSERDLAIDVFGDQHLNSDRSGEGDRDTFLRNLSRCGGDPGRVEILQRSSLDVLPDDILRTVGAVRLFSVDGGHTAECAYSDLRLADRTLAQRGVVILDDYFNEFWPEVCLGANAYFSDRDSRLRPFALTPGKMYLCAPEHNQFYRKVMCDRFHTRQRDKEVTMFGMTVQVMGMYYSKAPPLKKIRWRFGDSSLGEAIKLSLGRNPAPHPQSHRGRRLPS